MTLQSGTSLWRFILRVATSCFHFPWPVTEYVCKHVCVYTDTICWLDTVDSVMVSMCSMNSDICVFVPVYTQGLAPSKSEEQSGYHWASSLVWMSGNFVFESTQCWHIVWASPDRSGDGMCRALLWLHLSQLVGFTWWRWQLYSHPLVELLQPQCPSLASCTIKPCKNSCLTHIPSNTIT